MKKFIYFTAVGLLSTTLFACSSNNRNLENMSMQQNSNYASIVWNDKIYIPFCAIENSSRGVQIGIVDGDKDNQVYEYKGYSTDDWIISFYHSGEMDTSMLMREINVVDIPDNLESDYEWNNK